MESRSWLYSLIFFFLKLFWMYYIWGCHHSKEAIRFSIATLIAATMVQPFLLSSLSSGGMCLWRSLSSRRLLNRVMTWNLEVPWNPAHWTLATGTKCVLITTNTSPASPTRPCSSETMWMWTVLWVQNPKGPVRKRIRLSGCYGLLEQLLNPVSSAWNCE